VKPRLASGMSEQQSQIMQ